MKKRKKEHTIMINLFLTYNTTKSVLEQFKPLTVKLVPVFKYNKGILLQATAIYSPILMINRNINNLSVTSCLMYFVNKTIK